MSAVHSAIRQKCAKNAAVVIHHQVGIFPSTAQLDTRTMVAHKSLVESRPVVHVEINGFAVGREV